MHFKHINKNLHKTGNLIKQSEFHGLTEDDYIEDNSEVTGMTNTMQKLEQLSYFDTGTIITVETVDNSYQDAEFVDVDDVKAYGDGTVRVMRYVLMIRVNGSDLIGIPEDKLLSVTLNL